MVHLDEKVFVIGLPRTGTTSISIALLEMGCKVAHQAFTQQAFELADVVSDVPCFSDYQQLHQLYPRAKFIYLDRDITAWVCSMQMLLKKMLPHLAPTTGRFHPLMKRSFEACFALSYCDDPTDEFHLQQCYRFHKQQVCHYFNAQQSAYVDNFIQIDVSKATDMVRLQQFLFGSNFNKTIRMPHVNRGTHVASWDEYRHKSKISSHASGLLKRKYFSYQFDTAVLPWLKQG